MTSSLRITLVGNFVPDRQESMLRFGGLFEAGMQARGHAIETLSPTLGLAKLARPYRYGGWPKYLGYYDKFVTFPRRLRSHVRRTRPDVVHIVDHANAVYAKAAADTRVVTTVHDLLQIRAARGEIPQQQVGRFGRGYQAWILRHIGELPLAVCVSQKTADDLHRLTGISGERVAVIPNALNHAYAPMDREVAVRQLAGRFQGEPARMSRWTRAQGRFILNVGGGQWYKNRPALLDIYAQLRQSLSPAPVLVMVGKPLSSEDEARARRLGIADDVWVISGVTNEELQAFYSAAELLIFPSWEEGFGWPIAEAQACGCPVATSNRPPMNEVGGRSAIYFDPASPQTAAETILTQWGVRADRARIGLQEAERWRPEAMFSAYERVYRGQPV